MTQARQKTNNRGAGAAEILIQSLAKQQRQQKKTERKKKKTKNKEAKQSKTKKIKVWMSMWSEKLLSIV